ncbi:MAG: hypothetical protein Q8L47_03125 [bacterium]|nr:hypothetical protein [bacterium]
MKLNYFVNNEASMTQTLRRVGGKIFFSALALSLVVFSGGVNFAKAETATTTAQESAPVCELNKALNELLVIKDGSLTGIARDRAEFKARKAVVTQTIICADIEIAGTEASLTGLTLVAPEDEALRTQFLTSLNASKDQYAIYSDAIATSTGLFDIKNLAEDILTWRKNEYIPLLGQINDFILVISNEQSTKIARARFDKISSTISILRLSNVASIKSLLDGASALTTKADKLNTEAHLLVSAYFVPIPAYSTSSPSEILSNKTWEGKPPTGTDMLYATGTPVFIDSGFTNTQAVIENTDNKATSTPKLISTSTPTVVSLVKLSIISLKGAYTNYLKISVLVRNILGL